MTALYSAFNVLSKLVVLLVNRFCKFHDPG